MNQKLKLWPNSKTQILTKLKKLKFGGKKQNLNCEKTKILTKLKNWICDKTKFWENKKIKFWQNSKNQIVKKV